MNLKKTENKKINFFRFKKFILNPKYTIQKKSLQNYKALFLSVLFYFGLFEEKSKNNKKNLEISYLNYCENLELEIYSKNLSLFFERYADEQNSASVFFKAIDYGFEKFFLIVSNSLDPATKAEVFSNLSSQTKGILDFLKKHFPDYFNIIYKKLIILFYEKKQ